LKLMPCGQSAVYRFAAVAILKILLQSPNDRGGSFVNLTIVGLRVSYSFWAGNI
jgi:hypothetical protein